MKNVNIHAQSIVFELIGLIFTLKIV